MKYPKILAKSKPEQTITEHTTYCLEWFKKAISWHQQLIDKLSSNYGIPVDFIINRLFLTIAFHDIGKATEKFQDKIRGIKIEGLESHSLTSLCFIFPLIKENPILKIEGKSYYPEALSIVSHHAKLTEKLFDGYKKMKITYAVENEYFNTFYQFINTKAKELDIPLWKDVKFDEKILQSNPVILFKYEILNNLTSDEFKYEKTSIVRDVFLLFKSILHYCDWLASSGKLDYGYNTSDNKESITSKMKLKVSEFSKWSLFQKKASACGDKNIFVQIPTGQGKTEASVLWAVEKNSNQKILFLLPTMVTTNKMWDRMRHMLGGNNQVGLSHSTAKYVLKKDPEIEPENLRQHYLYNSTFFKPVTVATVDQLIYSFFNWGYWVLTGAASYNAKIIIDEIHIYDAYTFGLLLQVIKSISPYNTRFAIMSASLPDILKQELEKVLPEYELIKDDDYNNKQRHIIEVKDCFIEDCIPDIIADYKSGKKILIVCNTIGKAREIYDALKKKRVSTKKMMLYHSQFILKHKKEKEEFLEKIKEQEGGFIAICTQIVEVSLDIDFDGLYTENAPIDAIIQRLGRVNRKGILCKRFPDMKFAKVVITKESDKSRKFIYQKQKTILTKTYEQLSLFCKNLNGNLTEKDFKSIVELVYTRENLGENYFKELENAKQFISEIWKDFLSDIFTLNIEEAKIRKISSRENNYITVEAILKKDFESPEFGKMIDLNKFDELKEYTLKVPLYIARENAFIKVINDLDIYILDMKYSKDEGLSLKRGDENYLE